MKALFEQASRVKKAASRSCLALGFSVGFIFGFLMPVLALAQELPAPAETPAPAEEPSGETIPPAGEESSSADLVTPQAPAMPPSEPAPQLLRDLLPPPEAVLNAVAGITVVPSEATMRVGTSTVFEVNPADAAGQKIAAAETLKLRFSSDAETGIFLNANETKCTNELLDNELTLSTGGTVKRFCYKNLTPGTYKITVTAYEKGWNAEQTITVLPKPVPSLTGVSLRSDETIEISGNIETDFQVKTSGDANLHQLLASGGAASVQMAGTNEESFTPFVLKESNPILANYFAAKALPAPAADLLAKIAAGENPIFYLRVTNRDGVETFSLVDGFVKYAEGRDTELRINGDYPEGTYVYRGVLAEEGDAANNVPLEITMVVGRKSSGFDFQIEPRAGSRVNNSTVLTFSRDLPEVNYTFVSRPGGGTAVSGASLASFTGFSLLPEGPITLIVSTLDHTATTTLNYVKDVTGPELNAEFTVDGMPMTRTAMGFELAPDRKVAHEYLLQFSSAASSSEELREDLAGLYLLPSAGQTALLETYYASKPEPYRAYLNAAAAGTEPFAYLKTGSSTLRLLDGARRFLAGQETDLAIPSDFPRGQYTVRGVIKDAIGNQSTVEFTLVITEDTEAPVIEILPFSTAFTNQDVAVTASTSEGTLNEATHVFTANGSFVFIARDAAGNEASTTVTITNIDKTAPTLGRIVIAPTFTQADRLTLSGKSNLSVAVSDLASGVDPNSCRYTLNNGDLWVSDPNAYDPVSGRCVFAEIDTTTATVINVSATDRAGNYIDAVNDYVTDFQVDLTGPVFDPVDDLILEAESASGAIATYAPVAIDAVSGASTVSCSTASGASFALGETIVTCRAEDWAGNRSELAFTVTVKDTTAPALTISGPAVMEIEKHGVYVEPGATARDLVDGEIIVTVSGQVDANKPGDYELQYRAQDQAGNVATSSRLVKVLASRVVSTGSYSSGSTKNSYDKFDLALLMAEWGKEGYSRSDLNHDGVVDKYDLALLMEKWSDK